MDLLDAEAVQQVTDVRHAGEVLRPAFVLWLVVVGLLGGNAMVWTFLLPHLPPRSLLPLVTYETTYLVMAAVIVVFARRDRTACRVFARPGRGMVEMCLLVGIVAAMALAMWERALPWSGAVSPIVFEKGAGWPVWATLVTSAMLPAVVEELMYRGVILQRLRVVLSTPLALAVQAMMFSIMHMDSVYVLPHFAFGCLAGFLRLAARALWPCMLLHFTWNGWIVLEEYGWV